MVGQDSLGRSCMHLCHGMALYVVLAAGCMGTMCGGGDRFTEFVMNSLSDF